MSSAVSVFQCSHNESCWHLLMRVKFLVVFLWLVTIFTAGFLLPLCPLVLGSSVRLQVMQTSCEAEPFRMGEHYIWTHEPPSRFPDSTLGGEFLQTLAGVPSCNALCNKRAALTTLLPLLFPLCSPPPILLPCMRSFPVVTPVPHVIKNCSC